MDNALSENLCLDSSKIVILTITLLRNTNELLLDPTAIGIEGLITQIEFYIYVGLIGEE